MKKITVLVCILFLLCSCGTQQDKNNEINYPYTIESKRIDMSFYEGVSSTNNCFRSINAEQIFKTLEKNSSGVFYIGRQNCECCQNLTKYLNDIGLELGVTIYYLDVYNEDDPLVLEDENGKLYLSDSAKKLELVMYDILEERNGKRSLLTPHLFSVINGEFVGSEICTDFIEFDWDNTTKKDIRNLKNAYYKLLKPFAQ